MRRLSITAALTASVCLFASESGAKSNLRILTENWPPISYEENGKTQGMAVDLVRLIQKDIDDKSTIEIVPWARGYRMLLDTPNTLLFSVIRSKEREPLFTMLGPIAHGNMSLFALKKLLGNHSKSLAEIKTMTVAATRGTAFQAMLRRMNFKNIVDVRDSETAVRLLLAGRVDYLCDDSLTVLNLQKKLKVPLDTLKSTTTLDEYDLYLGFSPGTDSSTLKAWKNSLEQIKHNGQYEMIYHKWFADQKAPHAVELLGAIPEELKAPGKPEKRPLWVERQRLPAHD